jgi:superfamily I DNA and RNA helicase
MKKETTFVKRFANLAKGETPEVLAEKVFRQVQSALNTQIAIMTGDLVTKEDAVKDAQEAFEKTRLNYGRELKPGDRQNYVTSLVNAKNALQKAADELDSHVETLKFLRNELASLEAEI